jgi:integrase
VSLFKNADGMWEADVRVEGVGRFHGSMRTRKKVEAQPRYDALRRLFREAKGPFGADRRALIAQLRDGSLPIERLASMFAGGEALQPAQAVVEQSITWPTVDTSIKKYLEWIAGNARRRNSTWKTARSQLRKFAKFTIGDVRMGSLPLDRITSTHIETYQRALLDAKTPPNSVTAYMTRVGALWSWTQQRENRSAIEERRVAVVIHSPIDPETAARETSRRDRYLTEAEAEALLSVTPDRFRFVVATGLFAGLRIGEILHLRTNVDVDLTLGTLAVQVQQDWKPKTERSIRVVPIAADLLPIVLHHIDRYASSDWMMPAIEDPGVPFADSTFRWHFNQMVANAGLVNGRKDPRGVIFHTLRHTFASWLVMKGVDLYTVAKLLGDSVRMVEDVYADLSPDHKRRAIESLRGAIAIPASEGTADPAAAKISATDPATTGALK